jgi:hypothetical protein
MRGVVSRQTIVRICVVQWEQIKLGGHLLLFWLESFVFRLLSKNLKIKIHKTTILPVAYY